MWFPWVPLMKPVPKAGIFQVDLVGIELKLPYVARNPGYEKKVWPFLGELQNSFPRSSFPYDITSLGHQFSYKMIMKWWAREVIFHFPHSSFHFISYEYWWPREVDIIREDDRGKLIWSSPEKRSYLLLYPGFLATYGNLGSIPTKSTCKKPSFGSGFII